MEMTTSQASRTYGVFPGVLHRLIVMGRLKAHKDADGRWLISKESLEHWNRQRVRRTPKPETAGGKSDAEPVITMSDQEPGQR
jgi:hypothetical protein